MPIQSLRIQSWILAAAVAAIPFAAAAQSAPSADAAAKARAELVKRAEALTEDQVMQSHDMAGLSALGQVYAAQNDMPRFIWVLKRVGELSPNSGELKLQLALAYAKIDDKPHAYDTLIRMQTQGFGYDIANDKRFEPIHGTKVWDYLVANLNVNAKQFGEGRAAFTLPKGDYLYDALAWDAKRGDLLVGSVRDGSIQRVDTHGKLADFITAGADNGLWGVDALAVDATRGKLYASSSSTTIYRGFRGDNAGKAGIFEFDLASGKLLKKYAFEAGAGTHRLTALVVASDGKVYAADAARKQIFKLEDGKLRDIVNNPKLTSFSALAVSGDGRTLYLADYALGIFGYDLATGKAFQVAYDQSRLVLGGIVSMQWYDGTLVIVEDGMVPKRIMRLQLDKDGRKIANAMPLDVAHAAFAELGASTIAGDKLYTIVNRQGSLYDDHGVLTGADKLAPTTIFRSNLRFAWGQSGVSGGATEIAPDKSGKRKKAGIKPAVPAPEKH
jgi:sugar lactone lactonase YvrE